MVGNPEPVRSDHATLSIDGFVATITLSRPEKRNSISQQMLTDIGRALDQIEESDCRVVVVRGSEGNFSAGADLDYVAGLIEETPWRFEAEFLPFVQDTMNRIEDLPLPTIAVVEGYCLAGGFELMLCCDVVLAAKSARLGDGHSIYGFLPGSGGAYRLKRKVVAVRAKYIAYKGEFFAADDMREMGIVAKVCADEKIAVEAEALARTLSERSPIGLKRMKELIDIAAQSDRSGGLAAERTASAAHIGTYDMREGLAAFAEKRKPVFKGR